MHKRLIFLIGTLFCIHAFAEELSIQSKARAYLQKYETYLYWTLRLPNSEQADFLQFIEPTTPLSQKLREKWLYHLAKIQNWTLFDRYYRDTEIIGLRCYAQIAKYHLGQHQEALQASLPLWLSLTTESSTGCHALFAQLLQDHLLSQDHIKQRIAKALAQNQPDIAQTLIVQQGTQYSQELKMLKAITRDPHQILLLQPGPLSGALYLYGLNRLVLRNIEDAINVWQHSRSATLLNADQTQQFLAHLALYKAIRHEPDAEQWFAKVQPAYCNTTLQDWEIRYALLQKNWQRILQITHAVSLKEGEPFQLYWRARALTKLNQSNAAKTIYLSLANKRHYYGFLASHRLHQDLNFEFEASTHDLSILTPYKPILDQIAEHYRTRQFYLAAHGLNEFSLELSKPEKSALIYWVSTQLKWYGKAIYLSSQDDIMKNELLLRFPLAHHPIIEKLAKQYRISAALIYATIRQESSFLENSQSAVGAYGLMQLLPRTAKQIAKQAKIAYSNAKELFTPEKNIHIGVAYLKILHKQFHSHPVLVMAAYNAGPRQVHRWVNEQRNTDIDIWIETLPWQETRDYLKNVISFYAVYQYRMQEKPNLTPFLQPFI